MSRNKSQGRYAGKLQGKHYRSKAASVQPSQFDCYIHIKWKRMQHDNVSFAQMVKMYGIPADMKCVLLGSY